MDYIDIIQSKLIDHLFENGKDTHNANIIELVHVRLKIIISRMLDLKHTDEYYIDKFIAEAISIFKTALETVIEQETVISLKPCIEPLDHSIDRIIKEAIALMQHGPFFNLKSIGLIMNKLYYKRNDVCLNNDQNLIKSTLAVFRDVLQDMFFSIFPEIKNGDEKHDIVVTPMSNTMDSITINMLTCHDFHNLSVETYYPYFLLCDLFPHFSIPITSEEQNKKFQRYIKTPKNLIFDCIETTLDRIYTHWGTEFSKLAVDRKETLVRFGVVSIAHKLKADIVKVLVSLRKCRIMLILITMEILFNMYSNAQILNRIDRILQLDSFNLEYTGCGRVLILMLVSILGPYISQTQRFVTFMSSFILTSRCIEGINNQTSDREENDYTVFNVEKKNIYCNMHVMMQIQALKWNLFLDENYKTGEWKDADWYNTVIVRVADECWKRVTTQAILEMSETDTEVYNNIDTIYEDLHTVIRPKEFLNNSNICHIWFQLDYDVTDYRNQIYNNKNKI